MKNILFILIFVSIIDIYSSDSNLYMGFNIFILLILVGALGYLHTANINDKDKLE